MRLRPAPLLSSVHSVQRVKLVKADKVAKVQQTLVARAKAGQIRAKIDDAQLVEILGDAGASERSVTVEVRLLPARRPTVRRARR